LFKGKTQNELQRFGHISLPGERRADAVTEAGVQKIAANYLGKIDGAENGLILVAANQQAEVIVAATLIHIRGKLMFVFERRQDTAKELFAPSDQLQEFGPI